MQEEDLGRVLTAAMPDEVPVVTDLHHRARSLGKRKRMHRTALTAGGTGVAVVAMAGMALAVGGAGQGGGSESAAHPAAVTTPSTTGAEAVTTTDAAHAAGSDAAGKHSTEVLEAVKAVLPAGDVVKQDQYTAAAGKAVESLVVAKPGGEQFTLTVAAGPSDGSGASCPAGVPCTTGTGRLRGHDAGWAFFEQFDGTAPTKPARSGTTTEVRAGTDAEGLGIVDQAGGYGVVLTSTGKAPDLPTLDQLKHVGLNDSVVTALLAARAQ
jgi:hypothetical protein